MFDKLNTRRAVAVMAPMVRAEPTAAIQARIAEERKSLQAANARLAGLELDLRDIEARTKPGNGSRPLPEGSPVLK